MFVYFLCLVDIASSGGFTVLSTKAISTLLTRLGWVGLFSTWIAYPVLAVNQFLSP